MFNNRSPTFYLEMDGATTSKPVLQCTKTKYIKLKNSSNVMLLADLGSNYLIKWPSGEIETRYIALTGRGKDIKAIKETPFSVIVLVPKNISLDSELSLVEDYIHIANGEIFLNLPIACLQMLGYIK